VVELYCEVTIVYNPRLSLALRYNVSVAEHWREAAAQAVTNEGVVATF
jgi:hypothetical protein